MSLLLLLACSPTVEEHLGTWPFLTPVPAPATIAIGKTPLPTSAVTCGGCHTEFGREWSASTHASALQDLQFLAELAKPSSPRWLCLNCHIPTPAQRETLPTLESRLDDPRHLQGLKAKRNPDFDPTRVAEGVTCASCHVRTDPDGQATVVGPGFGGEAPHRIRADKASLDAVCLQCHSPGPAKLSPEFFCWFDTAGELKAGPDAQKSCVDCHMPPVERPLVAGGPVRKARQHHWVGGGVPKSYAGYETLLERGWKSGLEVETRFALETDLRVDLQLRNVAGHALPTADPERHLRLEIRLETAEGQPVEAQTLRIGQRWDWGEGKRPPQQVADERLQPGETRPWTVRFPARDWSALNLVVEAAHVRLTPANARLMAQTALDAELLRLWPEAAEKMPDFSRHYPIATYLYRQQIHLADGTIHLDTPEELLRRSAALAETPDLEARLSVP